MKSFTPLDAACAWCGAAMPADVAEQRPCDGCFAKWPKCAVSACQNKCCLRLNSIYCWPHTPGAMTEEDEETLLEEDDSFEDTNVEDSYAR